MGTYLQQIHALQTELAQMKKDFAILKADFEKFKGTNKTNNSIDKGCCRGCGAILTQEDLDYNGGRKDRCKDCN